MSMIIDRIADYVVSTRLSDIDQDTIERAKECFMQYLICAMSGRQMDCSIAAVNLSRRRSGREEAALVGNADLLSYEWAIFANAVLGQSTAQEDMHVESTTHPGSIIFPTALAVAEETGATGAEFLEAVIIGYDILCKIGTTMHTAGYIQGGYRPSGTFGTLGAAVTAAKLKKFSKEEVIAALGIAGNCSAGLREWAFAGSTEVSFHNGFAAKNGYLAVCLAELGIKGPASILEGKAGMANAFAHEDVDWDSLLQSFGKTYEVNNVYFKPYPACGAVQTAIQLSLQIHDKRHPDISKIQKIIVHTHSHGKHNPGCDYSGPFYNLGQATMSNQFGSALALITGSAAVDGYLRFSDPEVNELAGRIEVVIDPWCENLYPEKRPCKIEIIWEDGSSEVFSQEDLRYPTRQTSEEGLARCFGDSEAGRRILSQIRTLEQIENMKLVIANLR